MSQPDLLYFFSCMSISSQSCFLHLLYNDFHSKFSHFFIPFQIFSFLHSIMSQPDLLYFFSCMSISSQSCFLHLLYNVFHSKSFHLFVPLCLGPDLPHFSNACLYDLNLASLSSFIFCTIASTPHLLISSFHKVSDQFS